MLSKKAPVVIRTILATAALLVVGCRDESTPPVAPLGGAVERSAVTANIVASPALASSVAGSVAFEYSVIPLGNPYAINANGQIVGNESGAGRGAAAWSDATGFVLVAETREGKNCCSTFSSINNHGVAAGVEGSGGCRCFFLWDIATGQWRLLSTPGHDRVFQPRIDDNENVSGNDDAAGGRPFFIPAGGALTMLRLPPPYVSGWARDHNLSGAIVGYINILRQQHLPALWPSYLSDPIALPTLGGDHNEAYAINSAGDIVGWGEVSPGSATRHALLWPASGGLVDLHTWPNACPGSSVAWGLNDNGVIVGQCNGRPVLWTALEGMRYLPVPPHRQQAYTVSPPLVINNDLTIAGRSPGAGNDGQLWRVSDQTPPLVAATVSGTLGANDWYTSDVAIAWDVSDAESGIALSEGCETTTLGTNSGGTIYTCSATNGTGLVTMRTVTVKRDATVPSVGPVVTGTLGNGGWYISDVTVGWTVSAAGPSGITTAGCGTSNLTTDTPDVTYQCSATTGAGLSASASTSVKRDATRPVISFSSTGSTYGVDEIVSVNCTVSDAMSGLAASLCPSASGPAYQFGAGMHTLSATASDNAGNSLAASASFTVTITQGGICALVSRWTTNAGVANSLCVKLAQDTATAFVNELAAQEGNHIPAEKAAILKALALAFFGS